MRKAPETIRLIDVGPTCLRTPEDAARHRGNAAKRLEALSTHSHILDGGETALVFDVGLPQRRVMDLDRDTSECRA